MAKKMTTKKDAKQLTRMPCFDDMATRASKDKIETRSFHVAFILRECCSRADVAKVIRLAKKLLSALEG